MGSLVVVKLTSLLFTVMACPNKMLISCDLKQHIYQRLNVHEHFNLPHLLHDVLESWKTYPCSNFLQLTLQAIALTQSASVMGVFTVSSFNKTYN